VPSDFQRLALTAISQTLCGEGWLFTTAAVPPAHVFAIQFIGVPSNGAGAVRGFNFLFKGSFALRPDIFRRAKYL